MVMRIRISTFLKIILMPSIWAIDAYECKKFGDINPAKQTPEPHIASDFGDSYQF